jgi:serine/threonine protein kinase
MTPRSSPPNLDDFVFVDVLGSGGQATVYKYSQPAMSRMVAVKVLHGKLGPRTRSAFEAETRTMGQLSAHPNVVSIYQAGITVDLSAYFVMEFCPPPNLSVRVRKQHRPYGVPEALRTGIQIAGAVERAHSLGILHRDIKPANILVTEYGTPALTDFGIAASLVGADSGGAEGVSIPWAPPEQLVAGATLTPTADVYSLAATLWTLLVGRSPFEIPGGDNNNSALSRRVRTDPVPRIRRQDVPETLELVLARAMEKRPEPRFRSAIELARALQRVEAELHLPQTPFVGGQVTPGDGSDGVGEEERGSTRFVAYVPIDPDGPAQTGRGTRHTNPGMTHPDLTNLHADPRPDVITDGHGSAPVGVRDFTGPQLLNRGIEDTDLIPQRAPATPEQLPTGVSEPVAPAPRGTGRVVGILAIAALAVVAVVVSLATLLGGGSGGHSSTSSTSSGVNPMDAVGEDVPPVDGLALAPKGSGWLVTWNAAAPASADAFLYVAYRPGEPRPEYQSTSQTRVTVKKLQGMTCVSVLRVRAGRQSEAKEACRS